MRTVAAGRGRIFFFQAEDGIRVLVRSRGLGPSLSCVVSSAVVSPSNRSVRSRARPAMVRRCDSEIWLLMLNCVRSFWAGAVVEPSTDRTWTPASASRLDHAVSSVRQPVVTATRGRGVRNHHSWSLVWVAVELFGCPLWSHTVFEHLTPAYYLNLLKFQLSKMGG